MLFHHKKTKKIQFKEPAPKVTKKTAIEDLSEARAANETQPASKKKRTLKKIIPLSLKKPKVLKNMHCLLIAFLEMMTFDDISEDLVLVADSQKPSTNKKSNFFKILICLLFIVLSQISHLSLLFAE